MKWRDYDNFTSNDDKTEIKQLKVVYLQYYKTACSGVRAHAYIQSSSLSVLENMLPKVFKNRGHAAGHLHGLFFHFHTAGPNSQLTDSYRFKLKSECSSGACVSCSGNRGTQHASRKGLSREFIRSWEPGKAPAQQWLSFAGAVCLRTVFARLSAAL